MYLGWYRIGESGLVTAEADDWLARATQFGLPGSGRFIAAGKLWSGNEALQTANAGRITEAAKREYSEGRLLRPEDARPVYLRGALGDAEG